MRSSAKHAKQTLVDEQASLLPAAQFALSVLTFVLAARFIAADGANRFALQTELRPPERTRALGMRADSANPSPL